jgi:LEA14-like dessication related protein
MSDAWAAGRWWPRFAALVLTFALGGCALLHRDLEAPRVTLKGLTPEQLTSEGQVFRTRLLLENPNAEDLRVVGGQVTLSLAGMAAGRGETIERFTLPANGSQEVDLRVRLDLLGVLPDLLRVLALGPGELDYQLSGFVDLDVKALGRLPFKSRGKVSSEQLLRQLPGLLRRAPAPVADPL